MAGEGVVYRKVTPEEKLHLTRLQSFSFNFKADEKEIREKIAAGEFKSDDTYGAVASDGQVVAGIEAIPFTMWFDGQRVPMCGIGGVVSVPERRRQGNIRGVFEKVYGDIYEQGVVFSHLYPFSHDYYRQFGYEQCGAEKRYTIPISPARKLKNNGAAREYVKGDAAGEGIKKVYEDFASRHNLMISRTDERWKRTLDILFFGPDRLYYWMDSGEEIKSWVKFSKQDDVIGVKDIAWSDHESMLGILQFLGMYEGSAESISFVSSPEFIPELYWGNIYAIKSDAYRLGMGRVVNVGRALELMKKPVGGGKFTIKVTDSFWPKNSGVYSVEYGGGCEVKRVDASGADIEVSERALTQMVLGVYGLEVLADRDDIIINGDINELKKVFYAKKLMIADFF